MKTFGLAACFVVALSTAIGAMSPVGSFAAERNWKEVGQVDETCTVTPKFIFNNDDQQYYIHFVSQCSRRVRVTGTYNGAPFGVSIGANSSGDAAIGRNQPDGSLLRWTFNFE